MGGNRTSPEKSQEIAAYALERLACDDCGAPAGEPCTGPGQGRTVHKTRFAAAAITVRRQDKLARRTPEQAAILASLPRVSPEEIEAARSPRGGWTRDTLAGWGVPWPPVAGWRHALEHGKGGAQ